MVQPGTATASSVTGPGCPSGSGRRGLGVPPGDLARARGRRPRIAPGSTPVLEGDPQSVADGGPLAAHAATRRSSRCRPARSQRQRHLRRPVQQLGEPRAFHEVLRQRGHGEPQRASELLGIVGGSPNAVSVSIDVMITTVAPGRRARHHPKRVTPAPPAPRRRPRRARRIRHPPAARERPGTPGCRAASPRWARTLPTSGAVPPTRAVARP